MVPKAYERVQGVPPPRRGSQYAGITNRTNGKEENGCDGFARV